MSEILPFKKEYHCPKCGVLLTLGNCFNNSKGHMCIQCAKKLRVKTFQKLEEKQLTCRICSKELVLGGIVFTPTTVICANCYEFFKKSEFYAQHAKDRVQFGQYKATMSLLLIIMIVYAITSFPVFTATTEYFVRLGALTPDTLKYHEYWRFITANLMHANPHHLFANSISIVIWGHLLEKHIKSKAVFVLMIFSALLTTVFSMLFSPDTVSLGASGIAYGLMTAFIIYFIFVTLLNNPRQLKSQLFTFVVLVVFQVLYNVYAASNVDIWGHLGGTVAGLIFIIAYLIIALLKRSKMHLQI